MSGRLDLNQRPLLPNRCIRNARTFKSNVPFKTPKIATWTLPRLRCHDDEHTADIVPDEPLQRTQNGPGA